MIDSLAISIRPLKMRWILTCVTAVFLLAVTPASAQDYEATRHAAEQGDADAQFNLGDMYANGRGVPQDDAEAVRWYRLAAEQGHASAQFDLGFGYANGRGVPQDYAEAVRWYRLAAEQDDASAQFNLGVAYDNGEGVPQDYAEAVRWYRLAAEQGHASAQVSLGLMYRYGEGVPQDYAEAVRWYRLAAEQGFATAQLFLGLMYEAGEGVPAGPRWAISKSGSSEQRRAAVAPFRKEAGRAESRSVGRIWPVGPETARHRIRNLSGMERLWTLGP